MDSSHQPIAVLMIGPTASGKSHFAKTLQKTGEFVRIDSDAVKMELPEFSEMVKAGDTRAAEKVHEESSWLAKTMTGKAMDERYNVIFDGTGANAKNYEALVNKFHSKGYRVKLVAVSLQTVEENIASAKARAEKTGRHVPENFIRESFGKAQRTFIALRDKVDSYDLYDNTGKQGKLVMSKDTEGPKIHDLGLAEKFESAFGTVKKSSASAPMLPPAVSDDEIRRALENVAQEDDEQPLENPVDEMSDERKDDAAALW